MSTMQGVGGIVMDKMVLYWDVANNKSYTSGSSIINSLTNTNVSGSLQNTPAYSNTNTGILTLNGSNNYISATLPTFSSTYSLAFWLKINSLPTGVTTEIQLFGSPSDLASISLYNATPSLYKFLSWNGSTGRTGTTTLATGIWYNFVMVNSSNTVFYLNGVSDGTFANTGTLNSGAATIGCINGNLRFLTADISNIIFYNKALSSAEILQNYNAVKRRFRIN